ncbi:MAG: flagellar hook-length control protein FliK [Rhodobacteraceae bacterium]|nr:flagellar hook-length control protein FliK [Paracoccaceae bacterium]
MTSPVPGDIAGLLTRKPTRPEGETPAGSNVAENKQSRTDGGATGFDRLVAGTGTEPSSGRPEATAPTQDVSEVEDATIEGSTAADLGLTDLSQMSVSQRNKEDGVASVRPDADVDAHPLFSAEVAQASDAASAAPSGPEADRLARQSQVEGEPAHMQGRHMPAADTMSTPEAEMPQTGDVLGGLQVEPDQASGSDTLLQSKSASKHGGPDIADASLQQVIGTETDQQDRLSQTGAPAVPHAPAGPTNPDKPGRLANGPILSRSERDVPSVAASLGVVETRPTGLGTIDEGAQLTTQRSEPTRSVSAPALAMPDLPTVASDEALLTLNDAAKSPARWIQPSPLPSGPAPTTASLVPQTAVQIGEIMLRRPDGPVEVQLHPEDLGPIRLIVSQSETGMRVSISAERADVLDLLKRHADQLADDLRRLGYGDASLDFGQQFSRQADHQSALAARILDRAQPADEAATLPEPAPSKPAISNGRFDMRI